jgi:hypothetical protein
MYNDIYQAQQALLAHLQAGKTAEAFSCKTIKEYAGELTDKSLLNNVTPALLIAFIDGPGAGEQPREHRFYLVVTTKTDCYDKKKNHNDNLKLASQVGKYLDDNAAWQFTDDGETVEYVLDREKLTSRIFFQDNTYTCIIIEAYIKILL